MTNRITSVLAVLTLALSAGVAAAQPAVEAIVVKVEPSIACVLVSRSEAYRTFAPAAKTKPGRLGGFDADPNRFAGLLPSDGDFVRRSKIQAFLQKYDLADPDHVPEAFGSGLVVDKSGLVVTNYHVVLDAIKIYVRLPGGKGSYADIVAADPRCDLAVLKPIDSLAPLTPVVFGQGESLRRGQQVVALANPFAVGRADGQPSVSVGVVSNLNRRIPGRVAKFEASTEVVPFDHLGILVQTDARCALGSSGGGLFNAQGECVAITTSLAAINGTDAPGGFALPVNAGIRKIIDVLKRGEEVDYGLLGVVPDNAPNRGGCLVSRHPQTGSPADLARLTIGDVVVAVGDVPIHDRNDMLLNLGLYLAGEKVPLKVRRGNQELRFEPTLVKYHVPDRGKVIATSLGTRPFVGGLRVDYASLSTHNRGPFGAAMPKGALVTEVQDDSKAMRLPIFRDDIIVEVGGVAVDTPAAFYAQINRHAAPVELKIRRNDEIVRVQW